jgi:transposase
MICVTAADAEAVAEAASRPIMCFVSVKTEEQQARSSVFRTRDHLVKQRTQLINALRGHLAEHGVVAPQDPTRRRWPPQSLTPVNRYPFWSVTSAASISSKSSN